MLVMLGVAAASYVSYSEPAKLPTWTKVAGVVVAVLLLAIGRAVDSGGGFTSLDARPGEDPSDEDPSDEDPHGVEGASGE